MPMQSVEAKNATARDPKAPSLLAAPRVVLWFSLVAVMFLVVGFSYYSSEIRRIRQVKFSELSAIGQMKVEQIQRWRRERSDDSRRIANSPAVIKLTAEWLQDPGRIINKEELLSRLKLEEDLGVYFQALLVSTDQKIILSATSQPAEMEADSWAAVKKALTETAPVLSPLHFTPSGKIHIDIATAMRDHAGQLLAVLVLTTNADEFLFPMIQYWPTSSKSGETLLVRRDGDQVLFLNELRHRKDTALTLRFPLSKRTLPAAQAVLGRIGSFAGRDYRNVSVIADLRPIPGTEWYLVTKENESELRGEVRFRAVTVSIAVFLLILCCAGGMGFWYKSLQINERKKAEALLKDSETRYRRLFETAQDGILLLDARTGMITDVNPFLVKALGYAREEYIGKTLWEVRFLKDVISNQDNFLKLQREKYVRVEDVLLETADGRMIDVEFVGHVYQVDHHEVIQCNIRDITDRKRAQDALRQSEGKYRGLFESSRDAMMTLDPPSWKFTSGNASMLHMFRARDVSALAALHPWGLSPERQSDGSLSTEKAKEMIAKAMREGSHFFEWDHQRMDGEVFPAEVLLNRVERAGGAFLQTTVRDITDRRRAQDALRLKNLVFDSSVAGNSIADLHGVITECNDQFLRLWGYPAKEEVLGQTIAHFICSSDEAAGILTALNGRGQWEGEFNALRKDGSSFVARSQATIVRDEKGKALGYQSAVVDITQQKQMQRDLAQAKEMQFRALMESLPSKVFLKDKNSVYLSCNVNFARDLKIAPAEIAGKTDYDFFPTHVANKARDDDKSIMAAGKTESHEEEYHLIGDYLEGSQKAYVNIVKVPVRDADGNVTGLLGFFWDITERKRADEALRESKALIEAVVENAPFMIFLKEAKDLRFVLFNRAGEELLGYDRKALLGKNNLDLFPPEQAAHFMAKDREVLDGELGMLDIPEEPILTAKKGQRLLHTRKICVRGTDGVTKYLLGISEDITEQKNLEAEKTRVEVLASTSETKSKFTSMVSHELRSPLAVIKEALDIILEGIVGSVNPEQTEILGMAKTNIDRLGRLINNVLDFQKIEAGRMVFNLQENDPHEVLTEVYQSMSVLSKRKGLDLRLEVGEGLPRMRFDRDRIIQVLTNLMSNAIHNTESGGVILGANKEDDKLHVRVQDGGAGIAADDLPKLFQPFEQVDGNKSKKKGGTGLGLAISKEIVLAHHGQIWAESQQGKGSTFHFTLPL